MWLRIAVYLTNWRQFLYVSPLIDDKLRHNIFKVTVEQLAASEWFRSKFDNVVTKFIFNKQTHKILTSICVFTITRPQKGQMPGINEWKRRRKLVENKDKQILFKMTRTLPVALLAF